MTKPLIFFIILQAYGALLADDFQVQTVKLRLANPYNYGIIVTRMSGLNPRQMLSIEYLPPKGSRYFDGSLNIYVLPTDLVGLWPTTLNENASDSMIDVVKGNATIAFSKGEFTVWRVEQIRIGLTKVFLTIKRLDTNTLALIPNGPIQDGSVPEITFRRWHDIAGDSGDSSVL